MSRGGARAGAGRPFGTTKENINSKKESKITIGNTIVGLNTVGKKEQKRVKCLLEKENLYNELDDSIIKAYALSYQEWNESEVAIKKQGAVFLNSSGNPVTNPYIKVRNDAFKRMIDIAKEFGLTPKAREQLTIEPIKEKSVMAKILEGR